MNNKMLREDRPVSRAALALALLLGMAVRRLPNRPRCR